MSADATVEQRVERLEQRLEVLTGKLDRSEGSMSGRRTAPSADFHGMSPYAAVELDRVSRTQVARAIEAAQSDAVAACFEPRHGLRVVNAEETLDLVICFQCLQIAVYRTDATGPFQPVGVLPITGEPSALFNRLLEENGVTPPTDPFPH